jgi:ABC-type sugar transport system substrate-binding protein
MRTHGVRSWAPPVIAGILVASLGGPTLAQSPSGSPSGDRPEVVWLEQGAGNPYWDAQHAAAAAAGAKLGFDFRAVSGNLDPAQQAATLRQLVDQEPAVIMLNAIDPTATEPAVQYANEKGVPVVNLYGIDPNATASITFNEVKVGEIAAKHALQLLTERFGSPEGKIAVLTGIQGQPASDQRAQGFTDYMAQQEGVEVVDVQPTNWAADAASSTMQDWLVKYPDLAMVYALSDTLAVPAMEVAERQGRLCTTAEDWTANPSCVMFEAVDGIFLEQVGLGRMYGTQLYSPQWSGYKFAELAHAVATDQPFETETYLDALLVTAENAECVAQMQTEMAGDTANFAFEGSLADIAEARGCTVVTVE